MAENNPVSSTRRRKKDRSPEKTSPQPVVIAGRRADMNDKFENMINELKTTQNDEKPFICQACVPRNLLLLGRTRTGKSTIARMIANHLYVPEQKGLYAETREIEFNNIAGEFNGTVYHFNIIDSPGLFDLTQHGVEALTNERIQEIIDDCIKKDATNIHAFAFVFSAEGGINKEDIQSMILVKKKYPLLQNYMMLIITHCEEKDADERATFANDFFKHSDVMRNNLKDFFGLGTYFVGCLRPQLRHDPNLQSATYQLNNILAMRKTLLDFLMERENIFNIHRYHERGSTIRNNQPRNPPTTKNNFPGWLKIILIIFILITLFFSFFKK